MSITLVIALISTVIFIIAILSMIYISAMIEKKRIKYWNKTETEMFESFRQSEIMFRDVERERAKQKIAQEAAKAASNMYDRFDMMDFEE